MRSDPLADGLGPGGAGQFPGAEHILGQSQSPDEFAGAFHVVRLDHFIMTIISAEGFLSARCGAAQEMRLTHSRQIVALDPWSDLLGCHVGVRADVLRECR
jgi:hypothetical protein